MVESVVVVEKGVTSGLRTKGAGRLGAPRDQPVMVPFNLVTQVRPPHTVRRISQTLTLNTNVAQRSCRAHRRIHAEDPFQW